MLYSKADIIKYRLEMTRETFQAALYLAKGNYWKSVVNRLYFTCFYAVMALLTKHDIAEPDHAEIKLQFHRLYIKTNLIDVELGKMYTTLYNKQYECDYDDFVYFKQEDVEPFIPQVEEFIKAVEDILA
jgi:uncharacterized protein (UPF0332 family)